MTTIEFGEWLDAAIKSIYESIKEDLTSGYREFISIRVGTLEHVRNKFQSVVVEQKRKDAQHLGFDDYCEAHHLPYNDECPECKSLITT